MRYILRLSVCISVIIIIQVNVKAVEKSKWDLKVGAKGVYSTGQTDSYVYYKPYINGGYNSNIITILAGYSGLIDYQVSDNMDNYNYIVVHQVLASLGTSFIKNLDLNFEYEFYIGELDYERMEYLFEAEYSFEKFSLFGEFSFGNTEYYFNLQDIKSRNYGCSFEIGYFISDKISLDFSYTYGYISSDILDNIYQKHIFRLGTISGITDSTFIFGGLNTGGDSNNFGILGIDLGVNQYILGHVKVNVLYVYSYYISPDNSKKTTVPGQGHSTVTEVTDSYGFHKLLFGVEYRL
ncbi:hypothetical protein ACFL20_06050 [Spirochaetota bacterium]